ncbi:MAG: ABC transporter substrate-binding protein [Xanthobacteraceae bacterium]
MAQTRLGGRGQPRPTTSIAYTSKASPTYPAFISVTKLMYVILLSEMDIQRLKGKDGAPGRPLWVPLLTTLLLTSLTACNRNANTSTDPNKIRVGYIGLTCEAPIFSAVEKGFFKEEGLDVSLVKCEWANYKDVLALGGFDITHHLVMYFLKPVEQGLDVKFTGGIHRGCLRVQAAVNGSIHTVKDLRGKRIGVPGMGTPPFIFANRVLGANGIDPKTEITWLVFPAGELGLALDKGEVDAVADSEPIGSMLLAYGKVRNVADQAQ